MSDKTNQAIKQVHEGKALPDNLGAETNVHKIREILFGGQMREYDRRFDELSTRLENDTRRVKQDLEQRLDKFEAFIQKEFEQLNVKIQKERTERSDALEKTQQALSTADKTLTDKIGRLDEQFTRETAEIRKHVLTQVTELSNRANQLHEQLQAALKQETQRLNDMKVGRHDLAELLTEVALRLNDKFELPVPKA